MAKNFKITEVKVNTNWIYDTYSYSITVSAKVNGHKVEFPFTAARGGNIMFAGIDCNEARFMKDESTSFYDRFESVTISHGGTQTAFALQIYSSVLKSKPKENQKDFSFTGRYYSTVPIKKAFKDKMNKMFENNEFTNEFMNKVA